MGLKKKLEMLIYSDFDIDAEASKMFLINDNNSLNENRYQFSVIIPVYNAENYIERAISSVFRQIDVTVQLIVIDDGSIDHSGQICKSLLNTSDCIYLSHENKGQSAARNEGLQIAEGKYIFFLDADDCLIDNCLKKIYARMEDNRLDVLAFNILEERENGKVGVMPFPIQIHDGEVISGEEYLMKYGYQVTVPVWNYAFKRSFLREGGFLFREGYFHEDCEFTAHYFPYIRRLSYINEAFYKHNFTSISTMRSRNIKKAIDLINISIWIYRNAEIMKNRFDQKIVDGITRYAASEAFSSIVACVHNDFDLKEFLSDRERRDTIATLIRPEKKYYGIYLLLQMRQYKVIEGMIHIFSRKRE